MLAKALFLYLCQLLFAFHVTAAQDQSINVTYLYVNQAPYEQIVNQTWKFEYGDKDSKSLHGIISRSLDFIVKKHCPRYNLIPRKISSLSILVDFLTAENYSKLREAKIDGEHFIMGPLPMQTTLYHRMHYFSHLFSWQDGFAKSEGIVVVRRLDDVDLSKRIFRAIGKSKLLLCFVALVTCIMAAFMWVVDRDWKNWKNHQSKEGYKKVSTFRQIFHQIYWALITTVTVGPVDTGQNSTIGKWIGALWLMLSLIMVACTTSIITSDIVDSHVNLANMTVGIKTESWEEMMGKMLVNHYRTSKNIVRFDSYTELLDGLQNNREIFAGLIDNNVAATMRSAMSDRGLGKNFTLSNLMSHLIAIIDKKTTIAPTPSEPPDTCPRQEFY